MMIFLRSALYNLCFFTWTLIICVVCLPTLFMKPIGIIYVGRLWAVGTKFLSCVLLGIKMEVIGKENIPEGPCIIACKHQSAWETIMFYLFCEMPAFVLKKELTKIPLFGWYLTCVGGLIVDRSGGASALKQLILEAKDRLNEGRQLIIFPEGTRVKAGEKGKYQAGIAAIYKNVNTQVVPAALNSGVIWPKSSFIKTPGTIIIEFMEQTVYIPDHKFDDISDTIQNYAYTTMCFAEVKRENAVMIKDLYLMTAV